MRAASEDAWIIQKQSLHAGSGLGARLSMVSLAVQYGPKAWNARGARQRVSKNFAPKFTATIPELRLSRRREISSPQL
jgi:hypothetical protein